jgi:hypothetical protein
MHPLCDNIVRSILYIQKKENKQPEICFFWKYTISDKIFLHPPKIWKIGPPLTITFYIIEYVIKLLLLYSKNWNSKHFLYILPFYCKYSLVCLRMTLSGPDAMIEMFPIVFGRYVVTTNMYVIFDWRWLTILNCFSPQVSSSSKITFADGLNGLKWLSYR